MVTKDGGGLEKTGKLAFEHDDLGRVVKQTRTIDGQDYVVEKAFDAAGYLRGIKYPDGDIVGGFGGYGSNLTYDHAGRLSGIPGILTSVTYNALGAPLVQSNANLTTTTKTYDANRLWLTDIDTTGPNPTILRDLHYTMNAAGMAMGVDSNIPGEDWAYKYHDDLNFLMSSKNQPPPWTQGSSNAEDQSWTYDSLGRFTSNTRVGTIYTYPTSGPNSVRPHAPTSITGGLMGAISFDYDPNGNLKSDGNRTMTWDVDNRITKVVKGGTTTDFTYGPDGTRIKKVSGSQVVLYPFGDDYEINGATATKYINAGFGTIAKRGGTIATGFVTSWLHADRLGSINAVTDSTGAQVLRQNFRSYGELIAQTPAGAPAESLGYIGQRTDSETGLTYLHARYYDPALGTFVSPDPIGADRNTYRYANGDPVNFTDPSGLVATPFVDSCSLGLCYGESTNAVQKGNWEDLPGYGGYGGGSYGCGEWACDDGQGGGGGWDPEPQGPAAVPAPGPTPTPSPTPLPTATNTEVRKEVNQLMKEFARGLGPVKRTFGANSAITRQMMSAPLVVDLRAKFQKTGQAQKGHSTFGLIMSSSLDSELFGLDLVGNDSPFATTSLARQFLGSYNLTISSQGLFTITDSKSIWSATYHQIPSYNRLPGPSPQPFSTTWQTYQWVEGRK